MWLPGCFVESSNKNRGPICLWSQSMTPTQSYWGFCWTFPFRKNPVIHYCLIYWNFSFSKELVDKEEPEFVLKWADHNNQLLNIFQQLWTENSFTDVTLSTDKKSFKAHKLVLSACSPYFRNLFLGTPNKHQTVFVKDITSEHMSLLMDYMYRYCYHFKPCYFTNCFTHIRGSISVKQDELQEILKSASTLHIRGTNFL